MTNTELESRLQHLAQNERRITAEIISLIHEADRRRLYLERGYASLHDWLVRVYGYSHSAAHRRVQAARLLKDLPEIAGKIIDGSLNLTTVSLVQSALNTHERVNNLKVPIPDKSELIAKIENKSSNETQKILADAFPDAVKPRESLRHIGNDRSSLYVTLSGEDRAALERVKVLMAHSNPYATWSEVVGYSVRFVVKAKDKTASTRLAAAAAAQCDKSDAQIRREILARGCEYQDPLTAKVCGSHFQAEVDHIVMLSLGGLDEPENMRCLCRKHNLLMAEKNLGRKKMEKYWPKT